MNNNKESSSNQTSLPPVPDITPDNNIINDDKNIIDINDNNNQNNNDNNNNNNQNNSNNDNNDNNKIFIIDVNNEHKGKYFQERY